MHASGQPFVGTAAAAAHRHETWSVVAPVHPSLLEKVTWGSAVLSGYVGMASAPAAMAGVGRTRHCCKARTAYMGMQGRFTRIAGTCQISMTPPPLVSC
jgi:hypothetical protein